MFQKFFKNFSKTFPIKSFQNFLQDIFILYFHKKKVQLLSNKISKRKNAGYTICEIHIPVPLVPVNININKILNEEKFKSLQEVQNSKKKFPKKK